MDKTIAYLCLNIDVIILKQKQKVLLYKTTNNHNIESNIPEIINLVLELDKIENLYCVEIDKEKINENPYLSFLSELKDKSIGHVIYIKKHQNRPIVLRPLMPLSADGVWTDLQIKRNVLDYITNLTLYINNKCELDCTICKDGFKQFTLCRCEKGPEQNLPLKLIANLLSELKHSSLNSIHILGGNILHYPHLKKLTQLLSSVNANTKFFIHIENLINQKYINKVKYLVGSELNIIIHFPLSTQHLKKLKNFSFSLEKHTFNFVIKSNECINNSLDLISALNIKYYSFSPSFTGGNLSFFKKRVFTSKKILLNQNQSIKKIFLKKEINNFNFGKIILKSDGDYYSNFNYNKLGNIKNDNIRKIIFKEISNNGSWNLTREKVFPCSSCIYNILCPSVSNYEIINRRNNIINPVGCNIYKMEENHYD